MRIFRDLLATALVVIAFVALFEAGLRLAGVRYEYSLWESDPVLYTQYRPRAEGWEIKEGENFVRINRHGMRDRERSLAPDPATTRLALLGDSFVAAAQVPLEKTMGQVLERTLNRSFRNTGRSFEVLNFAQAGGTLAQQYLVLRDRVWDFQPRVVLAFVSPISVPTTSRKLDTVDSAKPFFLLRDGQIIPDPQDRPPAASAPEARRQHAFRANLMNRYRLLLLLHRGTYEARRRLAEGLAAVTGALGGAEAAADRKDVYPIDIWFRPPANAEVEEAWQVAEGLLKLMAEEAHRRGAEFWLLSIGAEIQDDPNAAERAAYLEPNGYSIVSYSEDRFARFAQRQRIPYVRLAPRMLEYAERNRVSVRGFFNTPPNRGHWNETGNFAAARIIADEIIERSDALHKLRAASR